MNEKSLSEKNELVCKQTFQGLVYNDDLIDCESFSRFEYEKET